jgi:hypothetical protein
MYLVVARGQAKICPALLEHVLMDNEDNEQMNKFIK